MFLVTVGTQSFVYTVSVMLSPLYIILSILLVQGDYNMTPDRHLGSVPLCNKVLMNYKRQK